MEQSKVEEVKKEDIANLKANVPTLFSKRWILAYIGMLGICVLYALRVNISVAVICMVRATNETEDRTNNDNSTCGSLSKSHDQDSGEFDWSKATVSLILSSFFYGYLVTQIPGGWFAGNFGGKTIMGLCILITSIATLILPVSARWDYRMVIALRIIMGIAEGVAFPSMHSMWGQWAPSAERTKLTSFSYAGTNVGNIVTFIVSGILCSDGFDNGWGSVFYVSGAAGLVWTICWFYVVADNPESHPTISKAEKDYIVMTRGTASKKKYKVPWGPLFRSRAVWVCVVGHTCNNWMHYTLLTGLPTFMKEVLKFDIKENGVLSAVPYIVMAVSAVSVGQLADLVRAKWLSTTATRRMFQTVGFLGSGSLIVALGFISCEDRVTAVVLLGVAVGMEGFAAAGYTVNHVDFAPRYAGVLYGITNCIATIPGILAPTVIGALTPNKTQEEWRNVFYICGGFTLIGAIVFGGFAQGELEPWAKDDDDEGWNQGDDKGTINDGFELEQKKEQNSLVINKTRL